MDALDFDRPIGVEEAKTAIQLRNVMAQRAMEERGLSAEDAEAEANIRLWVTALRASLERTSDERADLVANEAEAMLKELSGD
jgi:hypothetical protein